jgi:CO/xanthine dehydrogenase Mo-binding subunit
MWGFDRQDDCVMAADKVRYIGDEVAGVAAIDEDLAEEALNLISVEYEELLAVFDPEEAILPGASVIHDDTPNNIVLDLAIVRGDVERGFAQADVIVDDNFTTQPVIHCHLEPAACVASWDSNGKLTVWAGCMWPAGVRANLAEVLDMTLSKIRVINCHVGGAFGNRGSMLRPYAICALLARKAGRPVRMVNTREEEFMTTRHRTGTKFYMKLGAKKDGTITAEHAKVIADSGAYTHLSERLLIAMCLRSDAIYRFTNVKWEGKMVYTNKATTAMFRGFGSAQPTFVREQMMDILAERLGMDPVDLKLKNAIRAGDVTVHGWPINSCGLSECIQKVAKASGWKDKRGKLPPNRGIGLGLGGHTAGFHLAGERSTCQVNIDELGEVRVLSGRGEYGQGPTTMICMIVAEELGLRLEDVATNDAVDTQVIPYEASNYGSRGTVGQGRAAIAAAQDAKRQLFEVVAHKLGAKLEDMEAKEGRIFVKGSANKGLSFKEAVKAYNHSGKPLPLVGRDSYDPPSEAMDFKTGVGNVAVSWGFGAQVAEVEVDFETGEVRVLTVVAANDGGTILNPLHLEGSSEGGIVMSLGMALFESVRYDEKGRVITISFPTYGVPTALQTPKIEHIWVETYDPYGPYGAKGLAEVVSVPTVSAIANAIYDAVGVRIAKLPITPAKILKALEARSNS